MTRVAIMTAQAGWHGAQLRRALRQHRIEARYVNLAQCHIDTEAGAHALTIPGFARRLPDGVLVRSIPGGTFEQVTLRLDFLHALGELGVPVCNCARAIERSVDKAMASWLLKRAGIPTPPTWVTESPVQARAILVRETASGHELVGKPLFGSQGKGLRRLREGDDITDAQEYHGVWYLQRYVPSSEGKWYDWRVFVIGGSAVAAMARRGTGWINNVARGARCESVRIDDVMRRLALDAARTLGMDYAGIDIMRDANGSLTVIEANSIPSWKGLQSVTGFSIAQRLVYDFVQRRIEHRLEAVC